MKRFVTAGHPEAQLWLLPPSVDDFVPESSPVRALKELVDQLDVAAIRDRYLGGGRPAYDPVALVRILIFGLMCGVRSSRRLADALTYDLRFMYLAEMVTPDFRTIARFRAANEAQIRKLFKQTVKLGEVSGLITLEHVSVDGTKIEANAGRLKYRSGKELDVLLDKAEAVADTLLAEWKRNDEEDERGDPDNQPPKPVLDAEERKKRLQDAKETLAKRGAKGIVLTDQDSRLMMTSSGLKPGYNAQAAVDSHVQMIVAAEVSQAEHDSNHLEPMVEAVKDNTGRTPEKVSADRGYWSSEMLTYVDSQKLDAYIAPNGTPPSNSDSWTHDEEADTYTSSTGDLYEFERVRSRQKGKYRIYRCAATGKAKWFQVGMPKYSEMQRKTSTPSGSAIFRRRKAIVEPVFGHIKGAYDLRRLLLRGLPGAKVEYLLACVAHNLSKLLNNRKMIPAT